MDLAFGESVAQAAREMVAQGKDVNQTAKILFDKDSEGFNYGIGIILDGQGAPAKSSATLAKYAPKRARPPSQIRKKLQAFSSISQRLTKDILKRVRAHN